MSSPLSRRAPAIAVLVIVLALAIFAASRFWPHPREPKADVPNYEEYVTAFQVGVAALDADLPQVAEEKLTRAVELIPVEPAAWANRGLLYLRTSRLPEAERDLSEAVRQAPDSPDVQKLLGLLKQRQGQFGDAAAHLRRAITRDPQDVQAIYLLAKVVDQEQLPGSDAEYQRLMEQILAVRPENLRVLMDRLRVAVRRADSAAVEDGIRRFEKLAPSWHERTRVGFEKLKPVLKDQLGPQAVPRLLGFSNLLTAERTFSRNAADVSPPDTLAGNPIYTFSLLPNTRSAVAPADNELAFIADETQAPTEGRWDVVTPVWLTGEDTLVVFRANAQEVRRTDRDAIFPALGETPTGMIAVDWNNDARSDLLLCGSKGLRFHQQQDDGSFEDITATIGLDAETTSSALYSAVAADVDLDGDLDFIVSRATGPLWWLRNNLDGTFTQQPIFGPREGPHTMIWADLDHDGAPDAALLDAEGRLHVFANERSGQFRAWPATLPEDRLRAIAFGDLNDDGVFDIVGLREDGSIRIYSDRDKRSAWNVAELARWNDVSHDMLASVALLIGDFDNNGALDLLASGPSQAQLWLRQENREFQPLAAKLPAGLRFRRPMLYPVEHVVRNDEISLKPL